MASAYLYQVAGDGAPQDINPKPVHQTRFQ